MTGALVWHRPPNPRGTFIGRVILALIFGGIFAVWGVEERRISGFGAVGWALIIIAPVLAVALLIVAGRLRVGERARAERVYGPDWHLLSKAERKQSWLRFQAAQERHVVDAPAWPIPVLLAPSDPTNPYSVPIDRIRPPLA